MNHSRAFTLIELLISIACLALLVAILVPSITMAMAMARTTKCAANSRDIATAAMLYASRNNGYVMRDHDLRPDSTHYHWAARYSPYLGHEETDADFRRDSEQLYQMYKDMPELQCPSLSDPGAHVLHYVCNSVDFQGYQRKGRYVANNNAGPIRIQNLPGSPSQMYHITDANIHNADIEKDPHQFDRHDTWTVAHVPFDGETQNADPRTISADDNRHQGKTPVIFYDGHAEIRRLTPEGFPTTIFNPLHEP